MVFIRLFESGLSVGGKIHLKGALFLPGEIVEDQFTDIPVILDSSGIDIFFSFIILKSLSPIVMIGLLIWYRWHIPTILYHSLFYKKIILPFGKSPIISSSQNFIHLHHPLP